VSHITRSDLKTTM